MARNSFGGTSADVAENRSGARLPNKPGKVYAVQTGGSPITDLLTMTGSPLRSLMSDARGMVPEFLGPDSAERLWVDFDDGRVMLVANNIGTRMTGMISPDGTGVALPGRNGRFKVDANGNASTPGAVLAKNIGTARLYSGPTDPRTSQGATLQVGDVWVKFNG